MQNREGPERADDQQSAGPAPETSWGEASPQAHLLRLQGAAGNRATGRVLARRRGGKGKSTRPGGKGKSTPPARTVAPPLSPAHRNALERQVDDWFGLIQKLKALRIDAWEKNARIPKAKPTIDVLETVIAIVSLGFGGVAYGVIDRILADRTGHLLKEFILLSGLEAADLAALGVFHAAVKSVNSDVQTGIKNASSAEKLNKSAKGALKKGNDALSVYVEAMKLHTLMEEAEEHTTFNNSSADKSDVELQAKAAAMKLIYDELASRPDDYQRELTVGFMRLMEETRLQERAKRWGGNRDIAFYADPHWSTLRTGEIALNARTAANRVHDTGKWHSPDLSFDGFEAVSGAINRENLENIKDSTLQQLRLTMIFTFYVKNPYSGGWTTEGIDVMFKRDPSGRMIVIDREDQREWLTSYYTREARDHTDDERDRYAPLGAAKLFEAVKSKRIRSTRVVELHDNLGP